MKKEVITSLIVLLLITPIVLAEINNPQLPSETERLIKAGQKAQEVTDKINDINNPSTYLSDEIKKLMSQNPRIGGAITWLDNHELLLKIIFAEPFTITMRFFIVLVLWLFFTTQLYHLIKMALGMKWYYTLPSAIIATIVLAQTQLYKAIAFIIEFLVFKPEALWARIIIAGIIILVFIIISYLNKKFGAGLEERRKAKGEEGTRIASEEVKRVAQGLQRGMGAIG